MANKEIPNLDPASALGGTEVVHGVQSSNSRKITMNQIKTLALAVFGANGIMARTAAETFAARTITGTASEITVTNGDGVSGNPTLALHSGVYRAGGTDVPITDGGTGASTAADARANLGINSTNVKLTESLVIACSDETTALTTGTAKVTFRMPYAFTLSAVRASVTTAPTGTTLNVDINEGGVSILSTVITIDVSEKTSTTAATPAVISDTALADDAEITIDIDQIGSTVAGAGLKVYLIGTRT